MLTNLRQFVTPLGHDVPLHRNEGYRPFFIVGSGRCGTTLLRRILLESGQVHIPPETYVIPSIVHAYHKHSQLSWNNLVHLALSRFEYDAEFDRWNTSLASLARDLTKLDSSQRSLSHVIASVYAFHARQLSQPVQRWADKTPKYVFHLRTIQSVFPDARFVHLLRDGGDVVASMLKMKRPGYDLAACAKRWAGALSAFREFQVYNPDVCMELRYEDLVSQPEVNAQKIFDFVGLLFASEYIETTSKCDVLSDVTSLAHHQNVIRTISSDRVGRGREQFSTIQRQELQIIIGDEMQRYGYDAMA